MLCHVVVMQQDDTDDDYYGHTACHTYTNSLNRLRRNYVTPSLVDQQHAFTDEGFPFANGRKLRKRTSHGGFNKPHGTATSQKYCNLATPCAVRQHVLSRSSEMTAVTLHITFALITTPPVLCPKLPLTGSTTLGLQLRQF